MNTTLSIGEKITILRNRKKWSKKDLAENSGVHWTAISKYEHNHIEPSLAALKKIVSALNASFDYLIKDNYEPGPHLNDQDLFRLMIEIDNLPSDSKQTLKDIIYSFLNSQKKRSNL